MEDSAVYFIHYKAENKEGLKASYMQVVTGEFLKMGVDAENMVEREALIMFDSFYKSNEYTITSRLVREEQWPGELLGWCDGDEEEELIWDS